MRYTLDFKNKVIILLEKCNIKELWESLDEDKKDWDLAFTEHSVTKNANIGTPFVKHPLQPLEDWNNPYRKNPLVPPYIVTCDTSTNNVYI